MNTAELLAYLEQENIKQGADYKETYARQIGSSVPELRQLDVAANKVPQYYLNREMGNMMSDSSPTAENPRTSALMNKPTYEALMQELQQKSFQGR